MKLLNLIEALRDNYYVRVDGNPSQMKDQMMQAMGPLADSHFIKSCKISFLKPEDDYISVNAIYPDRLGSASTDIVIRKIRGKEYIKTEDLMNAISELEDRFGNIKSRLA